MTSDSMYAEPDSPIAVGPSSHRAALNRYEPTALRAILQGLRAEEAPVASRATELASRVVDRLDSHHVLDALRRELPRASLLVLGLFTVTEQPEWPLGGLIRALEVLDIEPVFALRPLLVSGLLALRLEATRPVPEDLEDPQRSGSPGTLLVAHPGAIASARTLVPEFAETSIPVVTQVRQIRQADSLEPILRTAVLWQRVVETPLRQTQQGSLYKRDRERLESDLALVGPIADMLEPVPDMLAFWLHLARGVGLVAAESGTDRIVAAPASYWSENAVHLPQMLAMSWMGLPQWHERVGERAVAPGLISALPHVRTAILLRLAALSADSWMPVEDLAEDLQRRVQHLTAPFGTETMPSMVVSEPFSEGESPPRGAARRPRAEAPQTESADREWLRAMLLGPAYQLGLVRVAEQDPTGRRVVQLTDLGRYALALGPPPLRPGFEHFLFVQPNFEIIAYRQGLNPTLIGQFSRFSRWSQLGAALELTLTPEDLYRGLEGGLTTQAILDRLARHSERPLPAGVAETLRTWAVRRERITYHAAATLVEFASGAELETALADWQTGPQPVRVAERLLLVEGEGSIPFHRFRMVGARDYRRPPESCVEVEPDGITLALDPHRSDLLVDAELARLAEELPHDPEHGEALLPRRRFRLTSRSIDRATEEGMAPNVVSRWFRKRTGDEIPPAVRLMMRARSSPGVAAGSLERATVLMVETPEILDGLIQHPVTRDFVLERLGPRAALIAETAAENLRHAVSDLGLSLDGPENDRGVREHPGENR